LQDIRVVTPSMVVKCQSPELLFDLESVDIQTVLDKERITRPSDYITAMATVLAMYWVFDVEYPKELRRTLSFLAGHVCQLEPFKATPLTQKTINVLYQ
jgi:hypothetical protein